MHFKIKNAEDRDGGNIIAKMKLNPETGEYKVIREGFKDQF